MKTQSKTVSVFHHLSGAAKIVIGSIIGAVVIVWFWPLAMHFFQEMFTKAGTIFSGK